MPKLTESPHLGDLLKYEADHYYSRDLLEVAPRQDLKMGTVIALKDNLLAPFKPQADDGSQNPAGVLLEDVKTVSQKGKAFCLARHGIVLEEALIWPEDIEAEEIEKALVDLKSLGLLTRKGL